MGRVVKRFGRVEPAEVLDARAQAAAILRAAHAEADALRAEARRAGEAAGRAEAQVASTSLMVGARADAERVRAAALPSARALAVRMAERIVGRALALDDATMVDIAAAALAAARAREGSIRLRVHPDDHAALAGARAALMARVPAAVDLELVVDPAVGRAGCVVETPSGKLDARLETQLAALERAAFGGGGGPAAIDRGTVRDG
ncbi:MAG: FliH/SctL family protein [Pseudomonadota bacterium]